MKYPAIPGYAALREKIRRTLVLGQQKIEEAKVQTYWQTGRLINEYLRKSENPNQEHGKKIVADLAKDFEFGEKVFYRCMRFAEAFTTFPTWRKLFWGHYRALIAVPDEKKRLALAEQASKGEWTCRDLEIEIRNLLWDERIAKTDGKMPSLLPVPVPGPFYTYQAIRPETIHSRSNELLIDLGFSTVLELNRVSSGKFAPDTIVTSAKDSKGEYSLSAARCALNELYTYQAFVERVVDGDTLKVEIDLGFNIRIRQTIRLRAIDCPEMDSPDELSKTRRAVLGAVSGKRTPSAAKKADPSLNQRTIQGGEGQAAKRFVERELAHCDFITVKSTQTRKEKWGRYLGDVFYANKEGRLTYLNNLLLEKGRAVRVRN
jgi:endonuclease YncB( thermonuclease family)